MNAVALDCTRDDARAAVDCDREGGHIAPTLCDAEGAETARRLEKADPFSPHGAGPAWAPDTRVGAPIHDEKGGAAMKAAR